MRNRRLRARRRRRWAPSRRRTTEKAMQRAERHDPWMTWQQQQRAPRSAIRVWVHHGQMRRQHHRHFRTPPRACWKRGAAALQQRAHAAAAVVAPAGPMRRGAAWAPAAALDWRLDAPRGPAAPPPRASRPAAPPRPQRTARSARTAHAAPPQRAPRAAAWRWRQPHRQVRRSARPTEKAAPGARVKGTLQLRQPPLRALRPARRQPASAPAPGAPLSRQQQPQGQQ